MRTHHRTIATLHQRRWFYFKRRQFHYEWCALWKANNFFSTGVEIGCGDGDDEIKCWINVPWLFGIYLGLDGFVWARKVKRECRLTFSDSAINVTPWGRQDEWRNIDPWWVRGFHINMPWQMRWESTEILEHKCPMAAKRIWIETRHHRLKPFEALGQQDKVKGQVSEAYPYRYTLKSGEVQERRATVHVERREWRARWWPLIPRRKSCTSISVDFDDEVGEGTGSWKGGTTGCGYDMLDHETPLDCLRRMESERRFER